jgi:methionyl-tRNA formyltransferase
MFVVFGSAGHHLGWTKNVLSSLREQTDHVFLHVKNRKEMRLASENLKENSLIIIVGWGWHISERVLNKHKVVGLHPSDLPKFAGGTPMQHQIIAGVSDTKMSLFELENIYDTGAIINKCDLSLKGGIEDIFSSLTEASISLIIDFLKDFPTYEKKEQKIDKDHVILKRLQHEDGQLSKDHFSKMSARQIYDFIRCREDPYPNTYYEDETGTVLFKKVSFVSKKR